MTDPPECGFILGSRSDPVRPGLQVPSDPILQCEEQRVFNLIQAETGRLLSDGTELKLL